MLTRVLQLIMKTENNFKSEKKLKFTQFCSFKELQNKSAFLKLAAQEFETGDFLNILEFLRFIFSSKKTSNS